MRQKRQFAAALNIAPERLRLVAYDTGGNFGAKNRPYVEHGLALWASRKLNRPIKYRATRHESMLTEYQGRDLSTKVELALAADGRFLAMRAENVMNVGAHCVSLSPLAKGAGLITGSYDIAAATLRARGIFTNTVPNNVMRSSGRPEVTFAIERLIDRRRASSASTASRCAAKSHPAGADALHQCGRLDLRQRHVRGQHGARHAHRRLGRLRRAAQRGRGARQAARTGLCELRRILDRLADRARGNHRHARQGRVEVVIGTQPSGQSHETSFAQVAADLLGVPIDNVDVILGDTNVVKEGGGSHSGRSMRHAATVLSMAAPELIAKGKTVAADILGVAGEVEFLDGRFGARAPIARSTFLNSPRRRTTRAATRVKRFVVKDNEMHTPVFPNGCAVCEVEVDPDTGRVHMTRYAVGR